MKYRRLTKEQFEELHPEFINFLATQTIDKTEWDKLKIEKPEVAEQELDVFSDMIWDGVLTRAQYLEHFSKNHIFLFECFEKEIKSIVLKSQHTNISFLTKDGLQWFSDNLFSDNIEMRLGTKQFSVDRNADIFQLIEQGSILSDGKLYNQINDILKN
jgi:hypothetical protein